MADLELVVGEQGFNVDFTIRDTAGTLVDISPFTTITLKIFPADFTAEDHSETLTQPGGGTDGVARWTVGSGDIPSSQGMYVAQIIMADATTTRKTRHMDFRVLRKLD